MKAKAIITALFLMFGLSAQADNDRPIRFDQLPKQAQQIINESFPNDRMSYAKMERDLFEVSYEVILVSGAKLEFGRKGEWREISTRNAAIDSKLIPAPILDYVKLHHPDNIIVKIERDRYTYEIKLNGGMQLKFDHSFRFVGWDD
ncbi:MAG: PepSY-like domain-containing protein [Rikenellaceae bacterium]|nr:PepSY-like domain-containing protein [Rikenellaceae bacterium]